MRTEVILANAGTGKTTALVHRAIQGVKLHDAAPVLITYTNAAAQVIRERLLDTMRHMTFVGTIHAYGVSLIRRHGQGILYDGAPRVAVIDEDGLKTLIHATISRFNKRKVSMTTVRKLMEKHGEDPEPGQETEAMIARDVYLTLRRDMLLTYPMILELAHELVRTRPNPDQTKLLLVDEYQDASKEVHELVQAVAAPTLFVVGDPRQAIFNFMGGDPKSLLDLAIAEGTFSDVLKQSYRCEPGIVRAADAVCLPPLEAMGHHPPGDLAPIEEKRLHMPDPYPSGLQELDSVAQLVGFDLATYPDETIGIVARTNHIVDEMAQALYARQIPFSRKARQDREEDFHQLMQFLQLAANPESEVLARANLLTMLGPERAEFEIGMALDQGLSVAKADRLKTIFWTEDGQPKDLTALQAAALAVNHLHISPITFGVLSRTIQELGLNTPEGAERGVSIGELTVALTGAEALYRTVQSPATTNPRVELATIHGAKGREWDRVYMVAANQNLSPGDTTSNQGERNLWYVAITRARTQVTITCAERRRRNAYALEETGVNPHLLWHELRSHEWVVK